MAGEWPGRVAIVGLGLIGGSLGLAIRERRPDVRVVGIDHDPATLGRARQRGAAHETHRSLRAGVAATDLIVLATPIAAILGQLDQLSSIVDADPLVTDVGSTKRVICERGRSALGDRFVGGHPMAGSERSGIDAARADLFRDRSWVLAPSHPQRPPEKLQAFLTTLGAHVMAMTPSDHDRVAAATSHLPQLLSVALGARLAEGANADEAYRALLSSGGADWLRIARSSPALWQDIVSTNADHLRDEIESLAAELERLPRDVAHLEAAFHRAHRLANAEPDALSWTITTEVECHGDQPRGTH